jgi:2-polyprenyl-6-methoxyphenol hydroxylase-like FAD-dependent oxidoreductase
MDHVPVLIVGAGPTGVALGCELARRGVAFRIIDAAAAAFSGSRGKGIQPRTMEIFFDLGLADEALSYGEYMPAFRIYDTSGGFRDETMHAGHVASASTPYPRPFVLPQFRTEELLRKRLASFGVTVQYGVEMKSLIADRNNVTAHLQTADGSSVLTADYVVGCDGGRSATRGEINIAFTGTTQEERRVYVADLKVEGLPRDSWHAWRHPQGFLNLAPLPSTGLFQYQASIGPDADEEIKIANLQAILNSRSGRNDIILSDMTWASVWRLNVRLAEHYRNGRIFLAGDACHVHSPAGAQGMNTGIQDAYNLGWKLSHVLSGAAVHLLDTYEEERRPIAAWMLGVTSALEEQAFTTRAFPSDRGDETLQLSLNYRGCSLSIDDRTAPGAVQAGDRAPDAICMGSHGPVGRLFETYRGPHLTVLAFGAGWDAIIREITERYASTQVRAYHVSRTISQTEMPSLSDFNGDIARIYDVKGDSLFIVRPDGYVGFVSDSVGAGPILDYLACLLPDRSLLVPA